MNTTSSQEASLTNILTGIVAGLVTAGLALLFGQSAQVPLVGIGVGVIFFFLAPMLGHLKIRWGHLDAFDDLSLAAAQLRVPRIRSLIANWDGFALVSRSSPDWAEARVRWNALLVIHDEARRLLAELEKGYEDFNHALSQDFKMTALQEELFKVRQAELDLIAAQIVDLEAMANSWILTGTGQVPVYAYVRDLNTSSSARRLVRGWEINELRKSPSKPSTPALEPYLGSERHHALLESHMHRSALS